MKLIYVEWVDSGTSGGWQPLHDAVRAAADDPMVCESVGWLLAESDRYLLLAPSRKIEHKPGTGEVCDTIQIPVEAVRDRKLLTIGRRA